MVPLRVPKVLLIGYGNTLRRDDAVGCQIAREIEAWHRPEVHVLEVAQLTPELAQAMADAQAVFFVDARADLSVSGCGVQVERLDPIGETAPSLGHASTPRFLMALCRAAYGFCPVSWLISVPAADFALGEGLSDVAVRGKDEALRAVEYLLESAVREPFSRPSCPRSEVVPFSHCSPHQDLSHDRPHHPG
jgi:hydrogenase maturation protease